MGKRIVLVLVALLFLLPIQSQAETTDEQTPTKPVHQFVIYGDTRTGHEIHKQIVALILEKKPEAVFHVGDMTGDGRTPSNWDRFEKITRDLQERTEFFPCLGNHEHESPLYFSYFGIPVSDRYYSADRFGIHFIVLDSCWPIDSGWIPDCGWPFVGFWPFVNSLPFTESTRQYNWLVKDLSEHASDFKVVILHHPLYSTSCIYSSCNKRVLDEQSRNSLIKVFQQYKVRIVFSGHEHNYERFYVDGIYYVVTGGGGAPLKGELGPKKLYTKNPESMKVPHKFLKSYNFCYLTYDGKELTVQVYNDKGDPIDNFSVTANKTK